MMPSECPSTYGDSTRELWRVFKQHAGTRGVLNEKQIRQVLNQLSLYPTNSQVYEVVHSACEHGGRAPMDHVTYGEFCILVTELQEHYRKNHPPQPPRSQLRDKTVLEERRKRRRHSVFLGGSCNPTTWRHDKAIPFLKQRGITFYNPQVSDWKPELIALEEQAKVNAELLFFVIDSQTRSTASMVEASYLAGCGRQLILVIGPLKSPVVIAGESISDCELEDLQRSHAYLIDLVERMGIPVFSGIDVALKCTYKAIHQNTRVVDLTLDDGAQPVRHPHARVADKLIQLHDVFKNVDTNQSGRLTMRDLRLAFKTITDEDLPANALTECDEYAKFTFEEFCTVMAEYRYKRKGLLRRLISSFFMLPCRLTNIIAGQPGRMLPENELRRSDVFLGGTCGSSTWREEIAIPILRKNGVSYVNPQLPMWSTRYIPFEAALKDKCRLLLYVITDETRAITSMLEAGHFLGQGCNVVLVIQNLKPGTKVEGDELSTTAIKDYNRARCYLSDLANKDGVPVFDKVEEAVKCAVDKLRQPRLL